MRDTDKELFWERAKELARKKSDLLYPDTYEHKERVYQRIALEKYKEMVYP